LIRPLNKRKIEVAEEITRLQKAAYKIEADIIGFEQLPPLLEQPEDIMASEEVYYGYYEEETLAGIISYIVKGDVLDIYKVAVHPGFFRRGIAARLLKHVEQVPGISRVIVSTALNNYPAVRLYSSKGYIRTHIREAKEGLLIVSFEKQLV
jgi:ribosomal protein S18 acetylase RimI-like enzyme